MKISVVTPTYNSAGTIRKNIESVITQTYKDFEHILVDNVSSDDTLKIAKEIYSESGINKKLKIINEKDKGIADAFNKGIKTSRGEIIAILNSDDYYLRPDIFEKVITQFRNEEILFVHGDILFKDNVYGSNIRRPLPAKMMRGVIYNHPTMFVRRSLYNKIGLFNLDYKLSMDFEFYCRIAQNFDPDKISAYLKDEPIVWMSSGGASWENELLSIEEIKKALTFHQLWNSEGKKFYSTRIRRTKIKRILHSLKMDFIVRTWRNKKWGNKF